MIGYLVVCDDGLRELGGRVVVAVGDVDAVQAVHPTEVDSPVQHPLVVPGEGGGGGGQATQRKEELRRRGTRGDRAVTAQVGVGRGEGGGASAVLKDLGELAIHAVHGRPPYMVLSSSTFTKASPSSMSTIVYLCADLVVSNTRTHARVPQSMGGEASAGC